VGGQSRYHIARHYSDGAVDPSLNPGQVNSVTEALAVQADGKILVGGHFTVLGGQGRTNLARLNRDGTVDSAFNTGAQYDTGGGEVRALAIQPDGKILLSGAFNMLGGQSRNGIGRLNSDGSLDTAFNPGANNFVTALAVQPNQRVVVGGSFTSLAGQNRSYLGRVLSNGALDPTFVTSTRDAVSCLALQPDGSILVGSGQFRFPSALLC
jgi:uncharacterized delta-60 repeat protein